MSQQPGNDEPTIPPAANTPASNLSIDERTQYPYRRARERIASRLIRPGARGQGAGLVWQRVRQTPNLVRASLKVASNKGASGIDGVSIQEVVKQAHKVLPRLKDESLRGTYQSGDIRRVWIPKPDGVQRGLGIPNVIDRVVQQACLQILEPLFDVGFHPSSHGYRRGRGAKTLVAEAEKYLSEGVRR